LVCDPGGRTALLQIVTIYPPFRVQHMTIAKQRPEGQHELIQQLGQTLQNILYSFYKEKCHCFQFPSIFNLQTLNAISKVNGKTLHVSVGQPSHYKIICTHKIAQRI